MNTKYSGVYATFPNPFTKDDGKILKSELRGEMHKLKSEIIMCVIGLLISQSGLILAIIKLFH